MQSHWPVFQSPVHDVAYTASVSGEKIFEVVAALSSHFLHGQNIEIALKCLLGRLSSSLSFFLWVLFTTVKLFLKLH